jgi:hypothetical protein
MSSFLLRHWSGSIGTWQSLVNTVAVYAISTALVVWIGSGFEITLSLAPSTIILSSVWIAANAWALIGLFRSAIRAIAGWHARKIEAVGGIVAIVLLIAVAYFITQDVLKLIRWTS